MDAAQKTLSVLDALAAETPGADRLADIAERAGLPRSTVHRILQRLVEHGYAYTEGDGRYVPGPRILALAGDVRRLLDRGQLRLILRTLHEEVGHTVHFAVLTGDEATYTVKIEDPDSAYRMASREGGRIPLHCTAIGKSLLAALPADERAAVIARLELTRRTPKTLTTPEALGRELEAIRARGFAIDDEENELSIRCVGAAVFDHRERVVGAVSVSSLTFELDQAAAERLGGRVLAAARDLSSALGARGA